MWCQSHFCCLYLWGHWGPTHLGLSVLPRYHFYQQCPKMSQFWKIRTSSGVWLEVPGSWEADEGSWNKKKVVASLRESIPWNSKHLSTHNIWGIFKNSSVIESFPQYGLPGFTCACSLFRRSPVDAALPTRKAWLEYTEHSIAVVKCDWEWDHAQCLKPFFLAVSFTWNLLLSTVAISAPGI